MDDGRGTLWVVATPIGNLSDLGARAVATLRRAHVILAEDTRVTRRLLDAEGITTPLESLHEHNEARACARLVERLVDGAELALVSDAGTPLLSDPGYLLVRAAQDAGVAVRVVPGPSAVTAALSVAGLATRPFWFEGFLPARGPARRERLARLRDLRATLVFFEAPHRVRECVGDMVQVLGAEREAAFARELSKRFEQVCRAPLGELATRLEREPARGEYVVLVSGAAQEATPAAELASVLECLLEVLPTRQAASTAARLTGATRNEAYALALQLKDERANEAQPPPEGC